MSDTTEYPLQTNLSSYGYEPSLAMAIVFLVIFGVSMVAHSWQAFKRPSPRWMVVMPIGLLLEVIGWGMRIWSRYDEVGGGYIGQICCLVIGPTFFSAALYMLLGHLIGLIAPDKSIVTAKTFKIIFIVADIFSLVLQGAGGGIAATAADESMGAIGSNLMLAGIIVQLIVMIIFVSYGAFWMWKASYEWRRAPRSLRMLVVGMAIASLMIIVRGIYRTAELAEGFSGPIAKSQPLFVLDAIPISIAAIALNIFHPSRLLPTRQDSWSGDSNNTSVEMHGDGTQDKYSVVR